MKVFRGLPHSDNKIPCALVIGNFDGVHLGHRALLAQARQAAQARHLPLCVMTFEPHPREYFATLNPQLTVPNRISQLRDKLYALQQEKVDLLVVEHFNARFASQAPADFVKQVLVDGLAVRWMLVGDDFRFGAKRAGDVTFLKQAGQDLGFEVEQMQTVTHQHVRISSSAIRSALALGDFDLTHALLGHAYSISGHVIHGQKLGRTLNFPTLNLAIKHNRPALQGIFVVQVYGLMADEHIALPAVASLGQRPTVDDSGRMLLEVHVFDFNQDVYGKLIRVEFLKKLRDEAKYTDLATLQHAIEQDAQQARHFFTTHTLPLSAATSPTVTSTQNL